jgi:hypothetical protein
VAALSGHAKRLNAHKSIGTASSIMSVIPAKAGIHLDLRPKSENGFQLSLG